LAAAMAHPPVPFLAPSMKALPLVRVTKELGKGGFGQALLGTTTFGGVAINVAVKVLRDCEQGASPSHRERRKKEDRAELRREMECLRRLADTRHCNKMYGPCDTDPASVVDGAFFPPQENVMMLELLPLSWKEAWHRPHRTPSLDFPFRLVYAPPMKTTVRGVTNYNAAASYLSHVLPQLKAALDELRAHGVVHGDLHPGNLMFKPLDLKVKLARQLDLQLIDFGLHKSLTGELSGGVPFFAFFGWVESIYDEEGYLGALRTCGMKATCCDDFGAVQTVMKLLATLDKTGDARTTLMKIQSTRPHDDAEYDAEYEGFRFHMGVEWLKSDQPWIKFWLEHEESVCTGPNEEWPEVHEKYCKFIRSVVSWKGACSGTILSFVELFDFPRPTWEEITSAMKKRQSRKRKHIDLCSN
jgi:hypothetical protein